MDNDKMNSPELIDAVEDWLDDIADKYAEHETEVDSTAAAPDTSNFRATRSGMIEVVKNVSTGTGDRYSLPKFFPIGIKVGGNVNVKIHQAIDAEVKRLWVDIVGDIKSEEPEAVQGNGINTPDGVWHYGKTTGTNWSMYGFIIS